MKGIGRGWGELPGPLCEEQGVQLKTGTPSLRPSHSDLRSLETAKPAERQVLLVALFLLAAAFLMVRGAQMRMGIKTYLDLYSASGSSGRTWPALCESLNSRRTSPSLPSALRKSTM